MDVNALKIFKDQTILITGGTGSFGQTFARRLMTHSQCKKVIIFSRDEWKQWEMRNSDPILNDPRMRYFLGDVRDASRLLRAFNEVDIVIHAAALKQVPAAEYNPTEFIKTNIIGAMNVIDQAIACGVKKVIALSSDKSVNPINLYGATKLCADRLFIAAHSYVGARGYPEMSVVRYGNVIGSRGSVIPFWKKILEGGSKVLPITDKRMTRFWISLEQTVDFVIESIPRTRGGEIFVPKIPSMHIEDLAKALDKDATYTYTGIREGEKLHELLIGPDDAPHTREFDDHYLILPEIMTPHTEVYKRFIKGREGKVLAENFSYASNTNSQWLTVDELRQMLPKIGH